MSSLNAGLCILIVALSPFPFGALLKHNYPAIHAKTSLIRGPLLAAASILLVWDVQKAGGNGRICFEFGAAAIGIGAILLVDGVSLVYLMRTDSSRWREQVAALPQISTPNVRMTFFVANSSASIWEELIFRYLPYIQCGDHAWQYLGAVFISSTLFALQHYAMGWRQVAYSCALGIFFSGLVWLTGSIWSSIGAHFVGNAFTMAIVRPILSRPTRHYTPPF